MLKSTGNGVGLVIMVHLRTLVGALVNHRAALPRIVYSRLKIYEAGGQWVAKIRLIRQKKYVFFVRRNCYKWNKMFM